MLLLSGSAKIGTMSKQRIRPAVRRGPFREGELVLLIDRKGRRYTTELAPEKTFHSHLGTLAHDQLIGQEEGSRVTTAHGHRLLALRPTLAELVLEMPRTTQVIYPKDLGPILLRGDIFPGARVVEAGLGSGALTSALLRAVGEHGQVTSYEVRADLVPRALRNIRVAVPDVDNLTVKAQDIYESGIQDEEVNRVVLDLAEPWRLVASAAEALVPGGIFLGFLPTVLQIHQLVLTLEDDGRFQLIEAVEVLERPWYVTRRSVRPTHRMVAHTGFIVTARRCVELPVPAREEPEAAVQEPAEDALRPEEAERDDS